VDATEEGRPFGPGEVQDGPIGVLAVPDQDLPGVRLLGEPEQEETAGTGHPAVQPGTPRDDPDTHIALTAEVEQVAELRGGGPADHLHIPGLVGGPGMPTTARSDGTGVPPVRDGPGTVPPLRRQLRMLRIPADPSAPVEVVTVEDSSLEISEALGGYLIDDRTVTCPAADRPLTIYLPDPEEEPPTRSRTPGKPRDVPAPATTPEPVPPAPGETAGPPRRPRPAHRWNARATALLTRLDPAGRDSAAPIRGPVLLAGTDPCTGRDTDVPETLLRAAALAGLLPSPGTLPG
jgi:hypothetical protein